MFEPFPIYDHRTGLRTDKEPWLLPPEAAQRLRNGFGYRGRIVKRPGFRILGLLGTPVVWETLLTISGGPPINRYWDWTVDFPNSFPAHVPILGSEKSPSLYKITLRCEPAVGGPYIYCYFQADGTITGDVENYDCFIYPSDAANYWNDDPGSSYGKQWGVRWDQDPKNPTPLQISYEYLKQNPTMLIEEQNDLLNGGGLYVCDTEDLYTWDSTEKRFYLDQEGVFTGDSNDFFDTVVVWLTSGRQMILTNNVDHPKKWDGTTLANVAAGGAVDVTAAKFVFNVNGYLVYLSPTVAGVEYKQGARWGDIGDPESVSVANEAVIPGSDPITSAGFVKDELIVQCGREVWNLHATDDYRAPFKWRHIAGGRTMRSDAKGSIGPFSTLSLPNRLITLSTVGLVECNGETIKTFDPGYPTLIDDFNPNEAARAYSIVVDEYEQGWMSYVSLDAEDPTQPNRAVIFSLDERMFADMDIESNCFGLFRGLGDIEAWDDAFPGMTWDEVDVAPDDWALQAGAPVVLAGSHDGRIFQYPNLYNYDGGDLWSWLEPDPGFAKYSYTFGPSKGIAFDWQSKQLNPYLRAEQPRMAVLGFVGFYGDAVPGETIHVSFYRDEKPTGYLSFDIDLTPSDGELKVWRWMDVHTEARSHKIRIEASNKRRLALDAIVPWFKPGGHLRQT